MRTCALIACALVSTVLLVGVSPADPVIVLSPAATYEGVPIVVPEEPVTVVQPDGYQVQTGPAEAKVIRQAPTTTTSTVAPHEETHDEYLARLHRQFCEDQPWECPPGEQPDGRESQR